MSAAPTGDPITTQHAAGPAARWRLAEPSASGTIVQDEAGRVVYANRAAALLFGGDAGRLLSRPYEALLADLDLFDRMGAPLPRSSMPGRRALAGDGDVRLVLGVRRRRDDGPIRWLLARSTVLLDGDGRAALVATTFGDLARSSDTLPSRAARTLGRSLRVEDTLRDTADLLVPSFAERCLVALADTERSVHMWAYRSADGAAAHVTRRTPVELAEYHPISRVLRTGAAVLLEALPHGLLSDFMPVDASPADTHCGIVVPLDIRGRRLGALVVAAPVDPDAYTYEDADALQEVGQQVAQALENAQSYEEEFSRRVDADVRTEAGRQFEAMADLIMSNLALPELLARLTERLRDLIDVDEVTILLKEADGSLTTHVALGLGDERRRVITVPRGAGFAGRIAEMARPVIVEDTSTITIHNPLLRGNVRSLAGVPMLVDGLVTGVLHVGTVDRRTFGPPDVALLRWVADRAASAIDRARLLDLERDARRAAERSARRANVLQRIASALTREVTADDVADRVVEEAHAALGASATAMIMRSGERLEVRASRGFSEGMLRRWGTFTVDAGTPAAEAVRTRRTVVVRSADDFRSRYPDVAVKDALMHDVTLAAVPVEIEGDAIGALALTIPRDHDTIDQDGDFVLALAQLAAQALERARLYDAERAASEELKRKRDQFAFLAEASAMLAASLESETVLQRVAELTVPLLADWCAVDVLENDAIRRVGSVAPDTPRADLFRRLNRYQVDPSGANPIVGVIRGRRPAQIPVVTHDVMEAVATDEEHLRTLEEFGPGSAMIVPLIADDDVYGSILFVRDRDGPRYMQADLDLAEALAHRAAMAIATARQYRRRSEIASTLEESLRPLELPSIPGVEVAARYRPAGEGTEVGGDFYDVVAVREGSWGVVLGDVCGKGAPAAALTALARYTVQAVGPSSGSPSAVLRALNEAILRQRDDLMFCTAVFASLDVGDGSIAVKICRAGHPPPMILRSDGTVETVGRPGGLLGIEDDIPLHDERLELRAGDALLLYTDGVTEARSGDAQFGTERLRQVLRGCAGITSHALVDRVERALLRFLSSPPGDDIALLALRPTPRP